MSTRRTDMTETLQAVLIGAAILFAGIALLAGDITIPRSFVGGALLALAGICYLASALLKIRHRPRNNDR
ncbi:hypothetical protein [Citricoccus sp. K5]|uniref:hypothetical protein n=1 Tax=Citricoccus sp. K5 TaxID=2653135 RepID=UPI0012F11105|nr:hypothetical protein [Citricoccus sp. K5]VXB42071.1 hypothetical protein CITRIK5_30498 [Citricoccus sp. K5]